MPYKIDRFNFSDQTIDNFNRVGITPDTVKGWIADGRANGIKDERIVDFIKDQYSEMNAPYEKGRDFAGGLRYAASNLPFVGDWVDEIEAGVRSKLGGASYDEIWRNARESQEGARRAFQENTQNGNLFDRSIGTHAPLAMRLSSDALLAALTGGTTLMPGVSGIQGAIEGAGSGTDDESRAVNAVLHGGLSYAAPAVLNKIFPTGNVGGKVLSSSAKGAILGSKKPLTKVVAKSLQTGVEPVTVIAKESTRATEPAILKGLQQALKGNDKQAKVLYDSAVRNVDYEGGFVKYIKDRMPKNLSEKALTRLSKGFAALENGFEEAATNTDDLLVRANLPEMIDAVINTAMRGASETERVAVKNAAVRAFSDRHIAKEVTKRLVPQSMVGNIGNQVSMIRPDRILTRPLSNIMSAGTLRTLRAGAKRSADPVVNNILDALRGATDSAIESTIRQ